MAVNNSVNLAPLITGTSNQIQVTPNPSTNVAAIALTSPFFNTSQPMFSAFLSSNQTNVSGDGTVYPIVFDTELFDQASNYNNSTGIFTAPVTANYLLIGVVGFISSSGGTTTAQIQVNATAATYPLFFQPGISASFTYILSGSCIVPMAANDTAKIEFINTGSTLTARVNGGTGQRATIFSGYLLP